MITLYCTLPSVRAALLLLLIGSCLPAIATPARRQMENLSCGIVAVKQGDQGAFVSWRLLGTDPEDLAFNLGFIDDHAASPGAPGLRF